MLILCVLFFFSRMISRNVLELLIKSRIKLFEHKNYLLLYNPPAQSTCLFFWNEWIKFILLFQNNLIIFLFLFYSLCVCVSMKTGSTLTEIKMKFFLPCTQGSNDDWYVLELEDIVKLGNGALLWSFFLNCNYQFCISC